MSIVDAKMTAIGWEDAEKNTICFRKSSAGLPKFEILKYVDFHVALPSSAVVHFVNNQPIWGAKGVVV